MVDRLVLKRVCVLFFAAMLFVVSLGAAVPDSEQTASLRDLYTTFGWPVEFAWSDPDGTKAAKGSDLCYVLEHLGYLTYVKGQTRYPAGDNWFLSDEEWQELQAGGALSETQVREMGRRVLADKAYWSDHSDFVDADVFLDMIKTYCPEFLPLCEGMEDSVLYWLVQDRSVSVVPSLLHELVHERDAVMAGCFGGRVVSEDGSWRVQWLDVPETFHFYDFGMEEVVSVVGLDIPKTSELLDLEQLSPNTVHTSYAELYLQPDTASDLFGVYGMTEELLASLAELRCKVILSSFATELSVSEHDLAKLYFWDGLIGAYLTELEQQQSELYDRVMGDVGFVQVLQDGFAFLEQQKDLTVFESGSGSELEALRMWQSVFGVSQTLLGEES